jgi:4-hydroxy 2-oxovalerate aldolase
MIKLLDCTLRDGGYYTNWDFDKELVQNYFNYIDKLPIEYVELGYRSETKDDYLGEYFYLPISTLKSIKKYTSKKLALMLNAKDCKGINLNELLSSIKEYVTLIRIATDPNKIEFSIELVKQIKELGFEVAINVMYISKIDENHDFFNFLDDIEKHIDTLNLVDSYGSIYPLELEKLINQVKSKTNISLGFHGHNNLELAFINTLRACECGIEFVDSTVLGMGRGAGNLKTELILTYLKSNKNIEVDLNTLGKLTELFSPLQEKYKWGTNLAYMVSGSYSLPQKDVMDALEINRYSLSGIVNQLKSDDNIKLKIFKENNIFENCLIIGGGQSLKEHLIAIKEFLSIQQKCLVIHSTSKYIKDFEDIKNTQYFGVAGDELLKVQSTSHIDKYILEPSPRKVNSKLDDPSNFYELEQIEFLDKYSDAPLTISLQIALDMKVTDIYLVGFDGYSELKNKKELYLMQENQEIIDSFISKKDLICLTSTKYKNINQKSIYGVLQCQ